MKALPQISEAEFQVMKIVWEHAPVSTNQVTEYLARTTKWSPQNDPDHAEAACTEKSPHL